MIKSSTTADGLGGEISPSSLETSCRGGGGIERTGIWKGFDRELSDVEMQGNTAGKPHKTSRLEKEHSPVSR